MKIRTLIGAVASCAYLAGCGQAGTGPGLVPKIDEWVEQVNTDALTGAKTTLLAREIQIEAGTAEVTAFCSQSPLGGAGLLAEAMGMDVSGFQSPEFQVVLLGRNEATTIEVGPVSLNELAGTTPVVKMRTFVASQEGVSVGYVDHLNSVKFQVSPSVYTNGPPSALKVEVPILTATGIGGTPTSGNVVVDLLPNDERIQALFKVCAPREDQPLAAPVAQPEAAVVPSPSTVSDSSNAEAEAEDEDNRIDPVAQ